MLSIVRSKGWISRRSENLSFNSRSPAAPLGFRQVAITRPLSFLSNNCLTCNAKKFSQNVQNSTMRYTGLKCRVNWRKCNHILLTNWLILYKVKSFFLRIQGQCLWKLLGPSKHRRSIVSKQMRTPTWRRRILSFHTASPWKKCGGR